MNEIDISGAIIDKLQLLDKLYDNMRIIDPIKKKVMYIKDEEFFESEFLCYNFWERKMVCDNCISMRAYNENETIFKIEYKSDIIYMITAVPLVINEMKIVIELIKDVTNSLCLKLVTNEHGDDKDEVFSVIEHLNQIAVRDDLTKLFNRRYINEMLPTDLLKAYIRNEPISIIFADLDFFKSVNDTYGHSAGDQVLREFPEEIKKHIRAENDWVARFGGEEFLICLPNTDAITANQIAERIRQGIMGKVFVIGECKISLTCSFGVHTVLNEKEYMSFDKLIEIVDIKLYKAKSEGRNRVV